MLLPLSTPFYSAKISCQSGKKGYTDETIHILIIGHTHKETGFLGDVT